MYEPRASTSDNKRVTPAAKSFTYILVEIANNGDIDNKRCRRCEQVQ